jgi:hypothetical protein
MVDQIDIPPRVRDIRIRQYVANFKNMWKGSKISNKPITTILYVLIRVHLAPIREVSRRIYILKEQEEAKEMQDAKVENLEAHDYNIRFLPRDHKRVIIKDEQRRLNKYEKKQGVKWDIRTNQ